MMKIIVVTDKSGKVAATYQPTEEPGYPVFQFHPLPDQSVHELELPTEYRLIESVEELHRRVEEYLKSRR